MCGSGERSGSPNSLRYPAPLMAQGVRPLRPRTAYGALTYTKCTLRLLASRASLWLRSRRFLDGFVELKKEPATSWVAVHLASVRTGLYSDP